MNKRFALYALPIFAAVAVLGIGFVSAHDDEEGFMHGWVKFKGVDKPGHEEIMDKKAESLGITVGELEEQMMEKKDNMLQKKADMLGIELEDLQEAMEDIKAGEMTWEEFLANAGVDSESLWTQKMGQNQAWLQEKLDQLVIEGELTEEEAAAKLTAMQEKFENREFGDKHKYFKGGWFHE